MNVSKKVCGNVNCKIKTLCHRYRYGALNKFKYEDGKCDNFLSHVNFLTKNV